MSEETKRRVLFNGKLVAGTPVRVQQTVNDQWSEFLLSDGTVLRVKPIVLEITRMDIYDPEGGPIYNAKIEFVRHVSYPEGLRVPPPGTE